MLWVVGLVAIHCLMVAVGKVFGSPTAIFGAAYGMTCLYVLVAFILRVMGVL